MRRETVDGRHHFMFMESSEIVSAAQGNRKWTEFQRRIHTLPTVAEFEHDAALGNESYVARSEKFLSEIEDQIPVSQGWRVVEDVVGGVPNVPAYLAGLPLHMRRRQRVDRDNAPIAIFMNLGSSMGIPPERILQRGLVLLALVRLLTTHRAVDLWVGTCLSDGRQTSSVAWRIDTAPLDLARAAFHIADVSMSRMFGYAMCEQMTDSHLGERPRDEGGSHTQMLKNVGGWHNIMVLPPIDYSDPMVVDPVGWLKRTMVDLNRVQPEGED